jgi:hypothetical protein
MDYLDYNHRIEQISGYLENDVEPIRMSVKYTQAKLKIGE